MRRRWTHFGVAGLLLAAAVIAVTIFERNGTTPATALAARRAVPVTTTPVQTAAMADSVTSYGNLVPVRTVDIVPNQPGQVERILFQDGQQVAAGTPLAVMDSRIAEAQVHSSRAQAGANQQNLQRTKSLASQGLDSTYSLEQAQAQAAASQANLQINLQKLDELTLRAPFAGTLGRRAVDAGAFLNAGEKIVRLDDSSQLQIEFRMPGSVTSAAVEGMPVHIELPERTGPVVHGKLSFIDPAISTDTRSVLLRAVVPNTGGVLRPGLYVRVTLDLTVHPHALVVPTGAVTRELGGAYVFVVDDKNIAHRQPVAVGLSDGSRLELLSGVKAGDRVVTVGQFRLQDGDPVKIIPAQPDKQGSS